MAKITKSERRQKKNWKNRHGMRVTGKTIFTIQNVLIKKGNKKHTDK